MTDGEGVDVTLEVGGIGTLPRTLQATRHGGRVSLIGVLTGLVGEVPIGPDPSPDAASERHLRRFAGDVRGSEPAARRNSRIEPVIDRVFDFADSLDALHYFQQGAHFGKVAIRFAAE